MKSSDAVNALKALAHASRLAVFRELVQAGDKGMTVGVLQNITRHAPATLTNHLNVLRRANLVKDRRDGRSIWCCADYARMNTLLSYLTENCCAGATCGPVNVCVSADTKSKRKSSR
jgi:ArsR family transcriptional regulator, arsenate/arsenite/antimonite-responsive transcriptional repressor